VEVHRHSLDRLNTINESKKKIIAIAEASRGNQPVGSGGV